MLLDGCLPKGLKILLLEEGPKIRILLQKEFGEDVECIDLCSLEEVFQYQENDSSHLVLFDTSLAGPTVEELQLISQNKNCLGFISLVNNSGEELPLRELGVDEVFLKKELSPHSLKKMITLFLERNKYKKLFEEESLKSIQSSKFALLGEMSSGIAHEIANPLSVILCRANRLSVKYSSDDYLKDSAQKIEKMVVRISRIIKTMRNFARNTSGEDFKECDLEEIINDTLDLCQEKLNSYSVNLRINGDFKKMKLECRGIEISQVLLNLIGNACDAIKAEDDRWVLLQVDEEDSWLIIKVRDSGKGITKELKDKIMQPFFTTKEKGEGTGIGLSISKRIIKNHGGLLYINEEVENTEFVIKLPKKHDSGIKKVG